MYRLQFTRNNWKKNVMQILFFCSLASTMKSKIEDLSQCPSNFICEQMDNYFTQTAKQRICIISALIKKFISNGNPKSCSSSFFATAISPYERQIVLSHKFVPLTADESKSTVQLKYAITIIMDMFRTG